MCDLLCSGFDFDLRSVGKEVLEEAIVAANEDPAVHGIMVYYPIWAGNPTHDNYIQETVALPKDVEGLCHRHLYNMYHNIRFLDPPANTRKSILPCTPLAIVKTLEHLQIYNPILAYGNRLFGKTITVINRSEVNGRPLAALLANDGATVYSVDLSGVQLFTRGQGIRAPRHQVHDMEDRGLADVLPLSDVVIAGVPAESFKVPTVLLRDGVVCINFSSYRNFDGPAVKEKASIYVPSIGKVTIAVLLRNLVVSTTRKPQHFTYRRRRRRLLRRSSLTSSPSVLLPVIAMRARRGPSDGDCVGSSCRGLVPEHCIRLSDASL